jgi:hypothetical protein
MSNNLKIAGILLFVLASFYAQAQNDNPKQQLFKIEDFKYDEPIAGFVKSSIDFDFKLKTSTLLNKPFKHPYNINFRLFNKEKLIWKNQTEKRFYAKKVSDDEFYDDRVFFQIPFDELDINSGNYALQLKITVSYKDHHFPMLFKKEIVIEVPKIYHYDEQEFIISNFQIAIDSITYKTPGFLISFTSQAKFTQNQIRGIKENPFIGEYLFYTQLRHRVSGEKISFYNTKTGSLLHTTNDLKYKHQLFIPFNELVLPAKNHDISVLLYTSSKNKSRNFSAIQTKNIQFKQPILHPVNFKLLTASLKEKKYDPSTVIGRIFSSTKSNIGKGNPDVYWELRTGNFVKFTSKTLDNSFTANPQECIIWVRNQDKLQLIFWDEDVFNDDWIETVNLVNSPIGILNKITKKQTQNLSELSIEFIKEE